MKTLCALGAAALLGAAPLFAAGYPEPTGPDFGLDFPFSMIGRIEGDFFDGSGTVVARRSVLTAAHVVYDPDIGWNTGIIFYRNLYDGVFTSDHQAARLYILGGYKERANRYGGESALAFARDQGGVRCRTRAGDGGWAGWWVNPAKLTGAAYNICLGYGAEFHSGELLLSVVPDQAFYRSRGLHYLNTSIYLESGMSGGPVFAQNRNGRYFVTAVIVSNRTEGPGFLAGVCAIGNATARLISRYLW